ncbi:MAG: hypothetical protein WC683_03360 [bacterium]
MSRRLTCAAIALVLFLAPSASQAGYRWDLNKMTKTGRIYHTSAWDAELIWHATFFDDAFREVFKKQHRKIKHLDPIDAERFEMEQGQRHGEGWDFFVSMYTKDEYKDFSTYEDSFWRIELKTGDGEVVKPMLVEKLQITPYERKMFPYLDRWSRGYRVTFPKVPLGNEIELTIMSVVGASTVKWNIR